MAWVLEFYNFKGLKSGEELKNLLMRMKEESERDGLKTKYLKN